MVLHSVYFMLFSKLINLPPAYEKKKILSTSCILFLCSIISREHRIISLAFCVYCSFNYTFLLSSAVILTDWRFTTRNTHQEIRLTGKQPYFSKLFHTHSNCFQGKIWKMKQEELISTPSLPKQCPSHLRKVISPQCTSLAGLKT